MNKFLFILLLFFLYNYINTSYIESYDNETRTNQIYKFNTPHFDLGSKNFPVSGRPIIGKGCSAIPNIPQNLIDKELSLSKNTSRLIVLVEYSSSDKTCFFMNHIFECQKRIWCEGVLVQDIFFIPSGQAMWSVFDTTRARSEYKVPLVDLSYEDFNSLVEIITNIQNRSNESDFLLTLTNDPNPWEEMFTSPAFIFYFQILTPIWSLSCFIWAIKIVYNDIITKSISNNNHIPNNNHISTSTQPIVRSQKITLKRICLSFHIISHLSRIVFSVDPFWSQQIFPYLVSWVLTSCVIAFEISANILLSFVLREITHAKQNIDVLKEVKVAYVFIAIFIALDFFLAITQGSQYAFFSVVHVTAFFYLFVNVILGFWYLWQAHKFLEKCSKFKDPAQKPHPARVVLIQTSIVNSIGMIFCGIIFYLIAVRSIFGNPWGQFSIYVLMTAALQIVSLCEIMLFGGVVFRCPRFDNYGKLRPKGGARVFAAAI